MPYINKKKEKSIEYITVILIEIYTICAIQEIYVTIEHTHTQKENSINIQKSGAYNNKGEIIKKRIIVQ